MHLINVAAVCLLLRPGILLTNPTWQSAGNVSQVEVLPNGVELQVAEGRVRILAVAPNVVRVRYASTGAFPAEHSFAVLPTAFPEATNVRVEQSQDSVSFSTGVVQVEILRTPLRVLFLNSEGQVISQDHPGSLRIPPQ